MSTHSIYPSYHSRRLGPNQITKLVLRNWQFTDISSITNIFATTHLRDLTMICCYIKPSGSSASTLPLAQPALASIDILEICRCCLMLDVLQWVATRLIDTGTLKIESDDDGYLAYILDNKLGLSVANICLALEPCEFPYSAVCFFFDHFAQRRARIPFHDCRDSWYSGQFTLKLVFGWIAGTNLKRQCKSSVSLYRLFSSLWNLNHACIWICSCNLFYRKSMNLYGKQ